MIGPATAGAAGMAAGRDGKGMRLALGLMSGTSLDGIDAALVETDGERAVPVGAPLTVPYDAVLREALRGALGATGPVTAVERALTEAHAAAVRRLLDSNRLAPSRVAVIGFHGHTILHRPREGVTRQIGDGALLARLCGIDVVNDFRANDVAQGGEGAPFVPLYHAALARELEKPLAVLNVGGVANLTWIGADGTVIAFDTGPGNAQLDDWVRRHTGRPFDEGGALAGSGTADGAILARLLARPYFDRPAPKSLDRLDFDLAAVDGLAPADGAATLAAFTCAAVGRALAHLPAAPRRWLVTGGGRRNATLMAGLATVLGVAVEPVEAVGWNGDALEAQAFAFLAVRSLRGLPLSLPATTGVRAPATGGILHRARAAGRKAF
jgi:anhydro-N-acetylmuramic acid kinase